MRFFRDNFRLLAPTDITTSTQAYAYWLRRQRKTKQETAERLRDFVRQYATAAKISKTNQIDSNRARIWIYAEGLGDRTHRDRYDRLSGYLT